MAQSIREVMTTNPVCLAANATVRQAALTMRDKSIGDVIVEKDGKACGIVTDRDIAIRAIADGKDPAKTNLESICSRDMTFMSPDQSVEDAVRMMKEKSLRRLPIVENGRIVGIVSLGDLAVERDPNSALGRISAASANH